MRDHVMARERTLRLVLCWHMHQPDYRNVLTGQFVLPWTYLHALKDYTDMAWHLERHPSVAAVVNFVPTLLEQLEDYRQQFLTGEIRDPLLGALINPELDDLLPETRRSLMQACFRCNHEKMVLPFPGYKRLLGLYETVQEGLEPCLEYLSGQFLADLLVWYHLAWTGESVRRNYPLVQKLMAQEGKYTIGQRKELFSMMGDVISELIPRYRALKEEGRVELSTTPYHHPILPLLLDFEAAMEAFPDISLPESSGYPGGKDRAFLQVQEAISRHSAHFGQPARGLWPAEGGLSTASLDVMIKAGCEWTASGEGVLVNTLKNQSSSFDEPKLTYLYRPYRYKTAEGVIHCFFRDDTLSDKIGFEYSRWDSKDAVKDFISALENIFHALPDDEDPIVTIILDGENAWEYYPYNGYYFFEHLYKELQNHPFIVSSTFSECIDLLSDPKSPCHHRVRLVDHLVAGSWVYGNFTTWIGDQAKNRAWDLLVEAKECFDRELKEGRLSGEKIAPAVRQLGICEGSDWFWWFGDYNPSDSVSAFDQLFRLNLSNLYRLLDCAAPAHLTQVISQGGGHAESGGTMRRSSR